MIAYLENMKTALVTTLPTALSFEFSKRFSSVLQQLDNYSSTICLQFSETLLTEFDLSLLRKMENTLVLLIYIRCDSVFFFFFFF